MFPSEASLLLAVDCLRPHISSELRQDLCIAFRSRCTLIADHNGMGRQVRNQLRMSGIFEEESVLPEHFYDQIWMVLFLKAMELKEEEIEGLHLNELTTMEDSNCRWLGKTLCRMYVQKNSLEEICRQQFPVDI